MNCWLVIDLRANRFAAALLDLDSGKPRWDPQQVTIYPLPDIYNIVTETDLTFYRRPNENAWIPTLRTSIGKLPQDFEIIPALLDMQFSSLSQLLTRTLAALLKDLLKEYRGLPLLFLIDRGDIQPLLAGLSNKAHRESTIYLAPDKLGDIEGFALLDMRQNDFPAENSIISCIVDSNGNEAETRIYQWSHHRFKRVEKETIASAPQSKWDSPADLQRAGLAIFCLVWQERLVPQIEHEIHVVEQENNTLSQIISRMNKFLKQLDELQSSSSR